MDLGSILRQALDLWQNPPFGELSEEAFVGCANRVMTEYGIELDLTPNAAFFTTKSAAFTFSSSTSREKTIPASIDDISRIIRVESRSLTSTNEDDWGSERIASFDGWDEISERGDESVVSFYGRPDELKMVVARDVSNTQFRIIYRQLQSKITARTELVSFPDIYEPLFVYAIALECGELIDNQSPEFKSKKNDKMPFLAAKLTAAQDRIERWRRSQTGSGTKHRRAFNDRDGGINIGRRKFTINF